MKRAMTGIAWWAPLVVALAGCLAGFALGIGAGYLEARVYFLFLYPAAIGVALGVTMGFLVYLTRCALPRTMSAVAVVVALAVLAGTWFGRYQVAEAEFAQVYRKSRIEGLVTPEDLDALGGSVADVVPDAEVAEAWQTFLRDETGGDDGLLGFVSVRSSSGLRTVGIAGFDLSTPWVLVAWSLEWLVMAGLVAFFTLGVARTPFCADCRRWHVQERIGRAPVGRLDALVAAMREGDIDAVHDLITVKTTAGSGAGRRTTGPVEIVADHCPRCEVGQVRLKVLRPGGLVAWDALVGSEEVERLRPKTA